MARNKMVNGVVIPLTAAEEAEVDAREAEWAAGAFDRSISNLREDRNRKLESTDFYALSDVSMSQAMTDYRQALRDLPAGLTTEAEVNAVSWPVAP